MFHRFGDFYLFIWFRDIPNFRMSVFSVDDADEVDCDGGRDKASASSRSEFESSPSCLRATYHFALVTKVDSGVYCAHIMCHLLFQCFFIIEQVKRMKSKEEEERYHIESN